MSIITIPDLGVINGIIDNLERYESGFPVLKEIIQNADDAGSSNDEIQLDFGLSQGIPSARHSLLKGPALYFINNGKFTEGNSKAIGIFGMGSKAGESGEPGAIGKYGLGMKSVFHFCEAFFYLAKNTALNKEYSDILTPWPAPYHSDWHGFAHEDVLLMREHLKACLEWEKRDDCFLLWLPLRRRDHLLRSNGESADGIVASFPGDETEAGKQQLAFLHESNLPQRLASLMPLLRRITRISFWKKISEPSFTVRLAEGCERMSCDLKQANKNATLHGMVINNDENGESRVSFAGKEHCLSESEAPELYALQNSKDWPTRHFIDEDAKQKVARDKAEGHCAAVFSLLGKSHGGSFGINWAVFLPVGKKFSEIAECDGTYSFRLTLHGYFFVDPGRVGIEGFPRQDGLAPLDERPNDKQELHRLWNSHLARLGVFPLILPALEAFVAECRGKDAPTRLSDDDIRNLSQGLAESETFKKYRSVICAEYSWIRRLMKENGGWQLLPAGRELRVLPPPKSAPKRPRDTLPRLAEFEQRGVIFVEKGAPHLVATPLPQWDVPDLLALLHIDEQKVFAEGVLLQYLTQFLEMDGEVYPFTRRGEIQERLREIFRKAFHAHGSALSKNRAGVRAFVALIKPEYRYPLNAKDEVIRALQDTVTAKLLLNREFDAQDKDNQGTAKFTPDETLALLRKLHELIVRNVDADTCRGIAQELLLKVPEEERRALLAQAEDLKILSGYDCSPGKEAPLSPVEVRACHQRGLVFRYSGRVDAQKYGLAPALQACITERVLVVRRETLDLIFGQNEREKIVPCDAGAALAALGNTPFVLQDDRRRQLIQATANAVLQTSEQRRGLRYLLHGSLQHFDYQDTLWVRGEGDSDVWGKIWEHWNRDASNRWTLLDSRLVGFIAPTNWPVLGLKPIDTFGILNAIQEKPGSLAGIELARSERETVLLAAASTSNKYLWQALPLHETVDGRQVSIREGQTYLQSDTLRLPDDLKAVIDLIVPSDNRQVRACQDRWIAPINPENILRIALKQPNPHRFCSLILDQLGGIGEARLDELVRLIPDYLLTKSWLLDADRKPVKPEDVIDLPEIPDEVNRLVAEAQGVFSSPENLSSAVRNHPNFDLLRQRAFSRDEQGLEKLALLLSDTPANWIGKISLPDTPHELGKIAQVAHSLLPGWGLLAQIVVRYPDFWRIPANELCREIAPDKTANILVALQKKHESATRGNAKPIIACFNLYLAAFAAQAGKAGLANLMLLNRAGEWRNSAQLCSGAVGVADSHLLDERQEGILYAVIDHANQRQQVAADAPSRRRPTNLQPRLEESRKTLRSFFNEWRDVVPAEEMICAFLVILGNSMEAVADEFKGKGSLGGIRNQIPWETHYRKDAAGTREWMHGIDKDAAFALFDFLVSVADGSTQIPVTSILGERISVPQQSDFTSLIVGRPYYEYLERGRHAVEINLRNPDRQATPDALSRYLREAAEYLLREVYNQKTVNLGNLWAELDKYDQLDINVAQTLILENLPSLLRQLRSVHKHDSLREEFKKMEDAHRNSIEFRKDETRKKEYEEEKAKHLKEIQRRLLEEDEAQEAVFTAVRVKMEEFQYTPERMPFELFQNADDAVVEYLAMQCHPQPPPEDDDACLEASNRRFVIALENGALYCAHWGRWINEVGIAPFPGREKGFHCDLEKMLMLSASDKSGDNSVTGKFGLGFKSVFLVSARPKLVSGRRLAAEIVGGLCPIPLKNEDASRYRKILNDLAPGANRPGTLVALPLDENAPVNLAEEFVRRAGALCIFAKRIRQIDVEGRTGSNGAQWDPAARRMGGARLEYGQVALSGDASDPQGALYFRFPEGKGGLLFGMSAKGFRALPAELPGIWVVAPTEDAPGLGLAVNGCFELDAGRRLLAPKKEGNAAQADALGRSFADALAGLHEASSDEANWPELRHWLGLAGDVSQYDFWHSLWVVLTGAVQGKEGAGHEAVRRIVAEKNGFGALLDRMDALPNGLWGDFQRLTRPGKIKKVVKGVLAEEDFFLKICVWDFFKEYLGAHDEVVTEKIVAQGERLVPLFGSAEFRYTPVRLAGVLQKFGNRNGQIEPETAAGLGALLKGLEKDERFANEQGEIKGESKAFRFRAKDGTFRDSGALLIADNAATGDEERRLAAFAPPEALLASEYQNDALSFFKLCRDRFRGVDIEDMTEWFLAADTFAKRCAALRYLRNGEHRELLAEQICKKKQESWVKDLDEKSQYFAGFDKNDIEYILDKSTSFEEKRAYRDAYNKFIANTSTQNEEEYSDDNIDTDSDDEFYDFIGNLTIRDANATLLNIYNWWSKVRLYGIIEYENRIYPDPHKINLEDDEQEGIDRSSWLMLFMLGSFHTMGRQHDGQHREFLRKCIRQGWWDIFSNKNSECGEWMGVLEESLQYGEYSHWMNRFRDIYLFSSYLDIYRDIFISIDNQPEISNLYGILSPRHNAVFQGSDLDAPSIYRSINFGVCFIIRELRRKLILKQDHADKFCYIPVQRIRKLCIKLGCPSLDYDKGYINDSKIIYTFLCNELGKEKADFLGCYDIPMQLLSLKKYRTTLQTLVV